MNAIGNGKKWGSTQKKKKSRVSFFIKNFGKWILALFIALWMFGLGVLVGRSTAPFKFDFERLQKELVALKNENMKNEAKEYKIDDGSLERNPDLGFHEALKKSSDVFAPKRAGDKKALSSTRDEAPPPRERKKAERPSPNRLTIQVASFKDPNDAQRCLAGLKEKGYKAYLVSGELEGKGTWHRIRVGAFARRAEAQSTLKRLKKEGVKPFLVCINKKNG